MALYNCQACIGTLTASPPSRSAPVDAVAAHAMFVVPSVAALGWYVLCLAPKASSRCPPRFAQGLQAALGMLRLFLLLPLFLPVHPTRLLCSKPGPCVLPPPVSVSGCRPCMYSVSCPATPPPVSCFQAQCCWFDASTKTPMDDVVSWLGKSCKVKRSVLLRGVTSNLAGHAHSRQHCIDSIVTRTLAP